MGPENKIEQDYRDWLRDEFPLLAIAIKLILFSGSGFPDRTILCKGQVFFIEFKYEDNGLSPQQVKWKERLERLGFKVYVCYTLSQAKRITKKHLGGL